MVSVAFKENRKKRRRKRTGRKEGEKREKGRKKERLERVSGVVESKGGYNLNVYM